MSLLAKIFVVIQAALVLVYLGVSATLYQHRRDWRTSYQKLKGRYGVAVQRASQEINALRAYVRAKDDLIEAKEREVGSMKLMLDNALNDYTSANQQYEELRSQHAQLLSAHNDLKNSLNDVHNRNQQLQASLDDYREKYDTARARRETAEGQVARLTALVGNLEADLAGLRETFASTRKALREKELLISMAEAQGYNFELNVPGPPVPQIDGAVTAVKNDIDPPLVLLSVGTDDKVERGYHFSIYRNNTFVGKVVVERVLRDSCSCRILFTAEGQGIQQGDRAATRLY